MEQYIPKSALVAEIEKKIKNLYPKGGQGMVVTKILKDHYEDLLSFINTIEVKHDSLENFKSLQHISGDLKSTLQDWGYAPNLYFFDTMWHVSWISCEEGDGIKDFDGNTPEEAIDKAYNWFHSTFCNS